jgi:hypothetical protein
MRNRLMPVVNYTHQMGVAKTLRSNECRRNKISSTTPVNRDIMYLTVSSVKLLNNVVVGTGN